MIDSGSSTSACEQFPYISEGNFKGLLPFLTSQSGNERN